MRKDIYESIKTAIEENVPEIGHIALWNQDVEFVEESEIWARPAVFVEFLPIVWAPTKSMLYKGRGELKLHVVTDWHPDGDYDSFMFSDKVVSALARLQSTYVSGWELKETHTNHNHEELVESIEVFSYRCCRRLE